MLKILAETNDIHLDKDGQVKGLKNYGDLFFLSLKEETFRKNPLPAYEKDMQFYLNPMLEFTDKASYLEWVKMWKWRYHELIRIQRFLKGELRKPHHGDISSWQMSWSNSLRRLLHAFCILRVEGKKKAAKLRAEQISRGIAGSDVEKPEEAQNTDGERGREKSQLNHARTGFWSSVQRKLAEVILRPMRQGSGIDR